MAEIAVAPFVMKDCIVSIEADDYAAAVSSVAFTPSSTVVTFKGLKPGAVFTDATPATWTLGLNYAQDWDSEDSLSRYLLANEGLSKAAIIHPKSGSGPSFEATIIITPGAIGGPGEAFAVATVTLGVQGSPELVEAP